ncbi:PTS system IIB component, L-Asc family [Clostridium amylolyticum]|uniref:PTS system IIB component, L-Asc family n=1 Tax=Clostridium amylolyticum TaxID=1121298 RepID=A0A1M6MZX5_9CLOT|nr:PTS sugar transporter subunit IIB [Clostridium amylolyticum]SHJ88932.1 PTS system IIB component, L-Asc family [Clostridium amylolyticum]
MAKKIKVLAVCGFGVGTSLLLKMNIDDVFKKNGIDADVTNADITTAASCPADIIFTSNELYNQLESKVEIPLIKIDNFMNLDEIEEKGVPAIKKLL